MLPGEVVRFVAPATAAEGLETFRILEVRGDRMLVTPVTSALAVAPTFVYLASDLCLAYTVSPCPLVVNALREAR